MPRLKTNGLELEYDARGQGPPVLLIMGIGAQMLLWREGFCDLLASAGYRVIRFDNRDIGLSTWLDGVRAPPPGKAVARALAGLPVSSPYTLWDMAADTIGLMDALGIERAHVVGASLGGMIGQCLAIRHAARLRSFTSIMSTTGDRKVSVGRPRALAALLGRRPQTRDGVVDYFVQFTKAVSGSGYPPDLDETREMAGRLFDRAHHPAGFIRHLSAALATGDRTAALRGVQVPTCVIHGDEDPLIPVRGGRATARAIPGAQLHVLRGLGHNLPPACWPTVVGWITDHLADADRAHGGSNGPDPIQ